MPGLPAALSSLLTGKLSAAVAVGAVTATVGTGAALTGALPPGLQRVAHTVLGAPAASTGTVSATASPSASPSTSATDTPSASATGSPTDSPTATPTSSPSGSATPTPSGSPVGPDASGPAAFGLCNAYAHGGVPAGTPPYLALQRAAGGGGITAYCATVQHPGHGKTTGSASPTGTATPSGSASAGGAATPAGHSGGHGHGAGHPKS